MLLTKAWFYQLLASDTDLITLLGDDGDITDMYPEEVTTFPLVIYMDDDQRDEEYSDNLPTVTSQTFTIDIFTKTTTGYPTTSEIGILIANLLKENMFSCTANGEVPDDTTGVRHRVMSFTRELFASDID